MMSKEKYQEAYQIALNPYNSMESRYSANQMMLELIEDIYPQYLKLKEMLKPYRPVYNINDGEFQCECGHLVKGHENYCCECGTELDWSEDNA
jgi:hypothetical protein